MTNIFIEHPDPKTPRVPFAIAPYTVALSKERGDVFDANRLAASFVVNQHGLGTRVETHKRYLRKGIASELIYQVAKLLDESERAALFTAEAQAKRNPAGQALYKKVQDRLAAETK